ncbi:hypothetical protein J7444_08130 [Labrenzia sp. R4_1]|uniref:hypothetical protein n=1 Tax=Labrenzia sp. R4_1 TaxID=2821106 RepID=UPI001ADC60C8|nr:hypothetical protein [Labrenzia sp. R4_1]MBO9424685.1 hypothetical protein [Labrenzia sp. R4_1]
MSRKSKMTIAFPRGGIIPAPVLKAEKDRKCDPGEPVSVPAPYGQHLVDEKFAVEVKAARAKTNKSGGSKPQDLTPLEAAVEKAQKAVVDADSDEAEQAAKDDLEEAQKALDAAKAA